MSAPTLSGKAVCTIRYCASCSNLICTACSFRELKDLELRDTLIYWSSIEAQRHQKSFDSWATCVNQLEAALASCDEEAPSALSTGDQ